MRDELAEARRRQAAGEFLTQRQMRLLSEAGTPAAAKEPWQMTQAEYEPFARDRFRQATEDAIARLEKGLSRFRPGMAQYEDALRGIAMQKQQLAEGLTSEGIRSTHRLHVRKAFLEGKPVRPEVLGDYPALAELKAPVVPIPKVLYHGGPRAQTFDFDKLALSTRADSGQLGYYFSPSEEAARFYAGETGSVRRYRLDAQRPHVMSQEEFRAYGSRRAFRNARERLLAEGYDVVVIPHMDEYVALRPEVIKPV